MLKKTICPFFTALCIGPVKTCNSDLCYKFADTATHFACYIFVSWELGCHLYIHFCIREPGHATKDVKEVYNSIKGPQKWHAIVH